MAAMRTQGPRTVEDAYAEAEKEIDRLRDALEAVVKAGTWVGTDELTYTSREARIARDVLAHLP